MSYKKREAEITEQAIAVFWNTIEADTEQLKRAFNYYIKVYPPTKDSSAEESYNDMLLEMFRLDIFSKYEEGRNTKTKDRNPRDVWLFNQVRRFLGHAYSNRKLLASREIHVDDTSSSSDQESYNSISSVFFTNLHVSVVCFGNNLIASPNLE
jgi:hypothetical protein